MWIGTCNESFFRREDVSRFESIRWDFTPPQLEFCASKPTKGLEIILYGLKAITKGRDDVFIGFSEDVCDVRNCIKEILITEWNKSIYSREYNFKAFQEACEGWICKTYKDYFVNDYLTRVNSKDTLLKATIGSKTMDEWIQQNIDPKKISEIYSEWSKRKDFIYP